LCGHVCLVFKLKINKTLDKLGRMCYITGMEKHYDFVAALAKDPLIAAGGDGPVSLVGAAFFLRQAYGIPDHMGIMVWNEVTGEADFSGPITEEEKAAKLRLARKLALQAKRERLAQVHKRAERYVSTLKRSGTGPAASWPHADRKRGL
jgi:hypothetical protein